LQTALGSSEKGSPHPGADRNLNYPGGIMANIPDDLHYSKDHEWVRVEGGVAIVGITDYAQDSLGDVVYVELPKVSDEFAANEPFGSVESVKAVSEVFSPVSGEIVAINETLADTPEKVNEDPYGEGWMIRVQLSNPGEVDSLLTAAEYEDFTKAETE
jgi:glycine cleavage system H protein